MRHLLTSLLVLLAPVTARGADPRVGIHLAYGSPAHNVVEHVSPPVIERGKTTRVTFNGTNLAPGLDVWAAIPKGALTAKPVSSDPTKLVFDITTAKDAEVGVCGLRLATRDGLTNAVLLHVEDLPMKEKQLPGCVWGTFREGTADKYTITVGAGERVSFECVAQRLGKDADPLLTIRDAAGRFVTERDNDPGFYFDFRFAHTFEKAGTYTLEVRDARLKASEHHHYILRVGKFPADRVAMPNAIAATDRLPGAFFQQVKGAKDGASAWVPVALAEGPVTVAKDFDPAHDEALWQATSGATWYAFRASPIRGNLFLPLERSLQYGGLQPTPAVVPGVLCGVLRQPGRKQAFSFQLEKGQRIFLRAEAR